MQIKEYPVIWFQASACSGCTVSVLNTLIPSVRHLLIDPVIPGKHINLVFQLTVMAGSGQMVLDAAETTVEHAKGEYILVVEGAVPYKEDGPIPITETLETFAQNARVIIALGTCAAFGGIPAAEPNPTNCQAVNHFLTGVSGQGIDTPFINLSGCPSHPDWFTQTVVDILLDRKIKLDQFYRPLRFYKETIHQNCPRYSDYMNDVFAKHPGDRGCFKEIGCKGRVTYADCPILKWNSGVSWCIEAGTPCIGCAEPYFPDIEIAEV